MAKYSAGSAVSGAASGAAAGAPFGPWGSAIGGVIGGAVGLFGSKKKKKKKPKIVDTMDPQQKELYADYIKSIRGEGPFSNLYNFDAEGANNNFDQNVSRPANRNFQENIIPGITGQFRGNNLQNSSYAGQALSRAGRDVQESLDAQRSNYIYNGQKQANQNRINGIQNALNTQTFAYQQPGEKKPSTLDQVLNSVGPAAGEWFADYLNTSRSKTSQPSQPSQNLTRGYTSPAMP